jgi:hypothetical protein
MMALLQFLCEHYWDSLSIGAALLEFRGLDDNRIGVQVV